MKALLNDGKITGRRPLIFTTKKQQIRIVAYLNGYDS